MQIVGNIYSKEKNMMHVAINAAQEAGKVLMEYYGKMITVQLKERQVDAASVFSEADLAAEETAVGILAKHFPDHNILAEEKTSIDKGSSYKWSIDPLDGTSNFLRHIPLFGVSIGLIHEQQSILGVLYFPALQLLVSAEKGKGAFANGKQIHVSARPLGQSLYYSGGYHRGTLGIENKVYPKTGFTKIIDASSYEFAQIGMGDAELYILQSVLHDVAAGVVIVREAGGRVTDFQGNEWNASSKGIVASNGVIHDEVLALMNS